MVEIHDTDKRVNKDLRIYRSLQSFQKQYIRSADKAQRLVERTLPILRNMLKFDDKVCIRIACIKARNFNGYYNHTTKIAEIDFRIINDMSILRVLAHELVHAEQYHQGRLVNTWDARKNRYRFEWFGERTNQGTTYKAYRNQPHEVEAWTRQESLAWDVVAELQRQGDKTFS